MVPASLLRIDASDAVSASAVARRIGLPRRLVTILEGESLVNDATALVIFGVAVAAATGGIVSGPRIALNALLAAGGGVAVGVAGAMLFGGTAEYVGLWFKSVGHEYLFPWYVTTLCAVALAASLSMPDTRKHGYLEGTQAPQT